MTSTRKRAHAGRRGHRRKAAATLAELGKSVDAIVTMLPTGKEVRACLLETEGGALAANLPKGAIVIDMSSADPVGTRALHADLAARGLALVDAPVSGGVPRATDGTLAIMIGGDAAAIADGQARAGKDGHAAVRGGRAGQRSRHEGAEQFRRRHRPSSRSSEAVLVGERFGLDPAVMIDIMNVSTGKSFNTENVMKQQVDLAAVRLRLRARPARQGRRDRRRSRRRHRGRAPAPSPFVGDCCGEARDSVGAEKDHTLAYTHWEGRDEKAAAE